MGIIMINLHFKDRFLLLRETCGCKLFVMPQSGEYLPFPQAARWRQNKQSQQVWGRRWRFSSLSVCISDKSPSGPVEAQIIILKWYSGLGLKKNYIPHFLKSEYDIFWVQMYPVTVPPPPALLTGDHRPPPGALKQRLRAGVSWGREGQR